MAVAFPPLQPILGFLSYKMEAGTKLSPVLVLWMPRTSSIHPETPL